MPKGLSNELPCFFDNIFVLGRIPLHPVGESVQAQASPQIQTRLEAPRFKEGNEFCDIWIGGVSCHPPSDIPHQRFGVHVVYMFHHLWIGVGVDRLEGQITQGVSESTCLVSVYCANCIIQIPLNNTGKYLGREWVRSVLTVHVHCVVLYVLETRRIHSRLIVITKKSGIKLMHPSGFLLGQVSIHIAANYIGEGRHGPTRKVLVIQNLLLDEAHNDFGVGRFLGLCNRSQRPQSFCYYLLVLCHHAGHEGFDHLTFFIWRNNTFGTHRGREVFPVLQHNRAELEKICNKPELNSCPAYCGIPESNVIKLIPFIAIEVHERIELAGVSGVSV